MMSRRYFFIKLSKSVNDDAAQKSLHGNQPKGDKMGCNIQGFVTAMKKIRVASAQDGDRAGQSEQGAGDSNFCNVVGSITGVNHWLSSFSCSNIFEYSAVHMSPNWSNAIKISKRPVQ